MADTPKDKGTAQAADNPAAPAPPAEADAPASEGAHPNLEQRIKDLEASLAASRGAMPVGLLPTHAAGPGNDIAETWSQAEQEASFADTLP